ncbi:MAG TPA: type IVB secretion system protein IcmH/DotU [Acetobacteraceae bacterium]
MSDNPFSEPAHEDRTIIRPAPGGRRAATNASPTAAPPVARAAPATRSLDPAPEPATTPAITLSPLTEAASTLLQLLAGLRQMRQQPDPGQLRDSVIRELRAFELRAREAGIKMDLLRPAHYALCASIDDVVLNTPWGAASGWNRTSLVTSFHNQAGGTDRFFDQLGELRKNPEKFLPVIELMYLCLSFGFMGRLRRSPDPVGELERLRSETHSVIAAQRKASEPELSPRWKGIAAPPRSSRGRLPVWVVLAAAAGVCGGLFFWVSTGLNAQSDVIQADVLAAPPSRMPRLTRAALVQPLPPPPAPAEPSVLDRVRGALQADAAAGRVSVLGSDAVPVLRIPDRGMFSAGSAVVQASALPLLERIGAALKDQPGSLRVLAYTDNQPIRSVRFPSNFQLSVARAQAVRAVIARSVGDAARVTAEGRADADPIAPNTTAEGREQNRRIEIVLRPANQ